MSSSAVGMFQENLQARPPLTTSIYHVLLSHTSKRASELIASKFLHDELPVCSLGRNNATRRSIVDRKSRKSTFNHGTLDGS